MGWPVKVILFSMMGFLGLFGHAMNGWGEPVAMASAAVLVPIFLRQFHKFWNQSRFWITVSLLAAIQVPLVVAVRPVIERSRALYSLEFGIIDIMFVGVVVILVCSKSSREGD